MPRIGLGSAIKDPEQQNLADKILNLLAQRRRMSKEELAQELGITPEDVAPLLDVLGEKEMLLRTKSGAMSLKQIRRRVPKEEFLDQLKEYSDAEEAIAKAAVSLIKPRDTVYITSGTVGFLMLKYLNDPALPITLVTSSVVIASEVKYFPNITLFVTGGEVTPKGTMMDAVSARRIREMAFDISFQTGAGLSAKWGLTNNTSQVIEHQRDVLASSRCKVLLMPSEKVGLRTFMHTADVSEFDVFITDEDSYPPEVEKIAAKGPELIIAK